MENIIQAYPLWQRGKLLIGCAPIAINCRTSQLGSMRSAWLVPKDCEGGADYDLRFADPGPDIENVLYGIWIQTADGEGIVLNVDSMFKLVEACDSCCGQVITVDPQYPPNYIFPSPTELDPVEFSFEREDNGGFLAIQKAEMDYYGQYIPGTFTIVSHQDGNTTYSFKSYKAPALIYTDTLITGGVSLASNLAPSLGPDQQYTFSLYNASGDLVGTAIQAETLEEIVQILNTTPDYAPYGKFTVDEGRIFATSSVYGTVLLLDKVNVAEPEAVTVLSNSAPTLTGTQHLSLAIEFDGVEYLPAIPGLTLTEVLHNLQNTAPYQHFGSWSIVDDQIQLTTFTTGTNTLTFTATTEFYSNHAPDQGPDDGLLLTIVQNGIPYPNVFTGDTLAQIIYALVPPAMTLSASWQESGDQIRMFATTEQNIMLLLSLAEKPAAVAISGAAPALSAGQTYRLELISESLGTALPMPAGATLQQLVDNSNFLPWSALFGVSSVVDGNKVQLDYHGFNTVTVNIIAMNFFSSNNLGVPTSGKSLQLSIYRDNDLLQPQYVRGDVDQLIVALEADPDLNALGDWSNSSNQLRLSNSTETGIALRLDEIDTPPLYAESNAAPSKGAGEYYILTAVLDGVTISPTITGNTVAALASGAQANSNYNSKGFWSDGDATVVLNSTVLNTAVLTITKAPSIIDSNDAPALSAGEHLEMTVINQSGQLSPILSADTVANLVVAANGNTVYTNLGTYSVNGSKVRLTSTVTTSNQCTITLTAEPDAAPLMAEEGGDEAPMARMARVGIQEESTEGTEDLENEAPAETEPVAEKEPTPKKAKTTKPKKTTKKK